MTIDIWATHSRHVIPASLQGILTAFRHPGASGSLCFADPENRIALAYVMNQMEFGTLPGPKVLGMVERLYA